MRFDIARSGSGLTYEIRHIVAVANKLKEYGVEVFWESATPSARAKKFRTG
jgi:alanine-synthesizing transaminase